MATQLQFFKFEHGGHFESIRTVVIDGEIWFVGADVAAVLGYKRPVETIRQHCKPKGTTKHRILTGGGMQEVVLINEGNVYRLIVKSTLPSAERFEEWLFDEVIPSIRKKGGYGIDRYETPNFIIRYFENFNKIEAGHFSVITELYIRLYARFEHIGYKIPNKAWDGREIRPDVSVGQCFAKYLRDNYPSAPSEFKTYTHSYPNGIEVEARMYPNMLLSIFADFVDLVWIPKNAEKYFYERDRKALDYLPKLLN